MSNSHEAIARAKKVAALVGAIDARSLEQGKCPKANAGQIALSSLEWTEEEWLYLAQRARVNPPHSETTKEAVRDEFRKRAERQLVAKRRAG